MATGIAAMASMEKDVDVSMDGPALYVPNVTRLTMGNPVLHANAALMVNVQMGEMTMDLARVKLAGRVLRASRVDQGFMDLHALSALLVILWMMMVCVMTALWAPDLVSVAKDGMV